MGTCSPEVGVIKVLKVMFCLLVFSHPLCRSQYLQWSAAGKDAVRCKLHPHMVHGEASQSTVCPDLMYKQVHVHMYVHACLHGNMYSVM